jgi:hypothetical protein
MRQTLFTLAAGIFGGAAHRSCRIANSDGDYSE